MGPFRVLLAGRRTMRTLAGSAYPTQPAHHHRQRCRFGARRQSVVMVTGISASTASNMFGPYRGSKVGVGSAAAASRSGKRCRGIHAGRPAAVAIPAWPRRHAEAKRALRHLQLPAPSTQRSRSRMRLARVLSVSRSPSETSAGKMPRTSARRTQVDRCAWHRRIREGAGA